MTEAFDLERRPPLDEGASADSWQAIADDALALLNEWDRQSPDGGRGQRHRVMNPDLADLYRRQKALAATLGLSEVPAND